MYEFNNNGVEGYGALANTNSPFSRLAGQVVSLVIERDQAVYDSKYDSLTEMLNKVAFETKIDEWIDEEKSFGLIYADLTNFKLVNDKLGHNKGDMHLLNTATILRFVLNQTLRLNNLDNTKNDVYQQITSTLHEEGRIGGDEIAILVDLTPREDTKMKPKKRMNKIRDRILSVFEGYLETNDWTDEYGEDLPFDIASHLGISLGCIVYNPKKHEDSKQLLHDADIKMQKHKFRQHIVKGTHRPSVDSI